MTLNDIRERVNVFLHPRRDRVLGAFRTLNVFVTLIAFGSLIAYYGYPLESSMAAKLIAVIKGSFAFYILHFAVRWFFDFHPLRFARAHALEAVLMGVLIVEGLSDILTSKVLPWTHLESKPLRIGPFGSCRPISWWFWSSRFPTGPVRCLGSDFTRPPSSFCPFSFSSFRERGF